MHYCSLCLQLISYEDVDEASLQHAETNIVRNDLTNRVTLIKSQTDGSILMHIFHEESRASVHDHWKWVNIFQMCFCYIDSCLRSQDRYDFTMCNPPFYSSRKEVLQSAEAKEFGPNAVRCAYRGNYCVFMTDYYVQVCTGADVEMITPGGEAAFVCKMVHESTVLRERCRWIALSLYFWRIWRCFRWYTSMLGKLSSLTEVVTLLRSQHVSVIRLVSSKSWQMLIGT